MTNVPPASSPRVEQLVSDLGIAVANATYLLRRALEDVASRDDALSLCRTELRAELEQVRRLRSCLVALAPKLDATERDAVDALLRELDEERATRDDEERGTR